MNMPTVSRAATGQETEGAGDTTIRERAVGPLGAADNVKSDIATPKNTEEKTESTDDKSPNKPDLVDSDIATLKDTEEKTESTDDKSSSEPNLLDNSIAKSKRGAGPRNRRPPTRTNRQ